MPTIIDIPSSDSTLPDLEKKEEEDPNNAQDTDTDTTQNPDSWDSPSNLDNPQNWSFRKKVFHTAVPAFYGFVITVGTSSYVAAIPLVMSEFHIIREIAVLPLSLYTLGLSFGPIFAAPISELYGRRVVYWTTMTLLLIFTAICGAANSIELLIVFRFLAGAGGSAALAIGAGSISDMWSNQHRGLASLFFVLSPFMGPCLGPLTGAYIIHEYNEDWRWSMWVIMIIAAPVAVLALFMDESSKTQILYLKQKRAGVEVPKHKKGDTMVFLRKLKTGFTRPVHMMFVEPLVALVSIYTGFAFAMMFSFFGSYTYVFSTIYHFNQRQIGLTYLGIMIGFFFAVATFGFFDKVVYRKKVREGGGRTEPEHRLYAGMVGSLLLPVGLFWFAWAPQKDVHWIVPVLAGVPFGWGCLAIFISSTTYLVDVYQAANGASALAANGILRYGLGAIFPLFTIQMYKALGIHWAGSTFAFVSLLMLPVPWVFFWKGKGVRARSRYVVSTV